MKVVAIPIQYTQGNRESSSGEDHIELTRTDSRAKVYVIDHWMQK